MNDLIDWRFCTYFLFYEFFLMKPSKWMDQLVLRCSFRWYGGSERVKYLV